MRGPSLSQTIAEVVSCEPISRGTFLEALASRHPDLDREQIERFLQLDTTIADVQGGVVHVPSLLEGTTWTVWVDADDAARDFVRTHPYLAPLGWWLFGDDVELVSAGGERLGVLGTEGIWLDGRDTDVVTGPDGWLRPFAGRWATVEVVAGALRWSVCESPPVATGAQVAAMRTGFERAVLADTHLGSDRPPPPDPRFSSGDGPVHEALVADRSAFVDSPIPPLPALYGAAGLVERGSIIAGEGFDWDALHGWQDRNRLAMSYGLDDEGVERVVLAVGACQTFADQGDAALGTTDEERQGAAALLAGCLEGGAVAEAFWEECDRRDVPVADLDRFAGELIDRLDPVLPVGLAWLRARCLDLSGEASAAVDLLERAVDEGCDHEPALVDLAGLAADRGEAVLALHLLRRAGVIGRLEEDVDELDHAELLFEEVAGFAVHRPRPMAGRNDRCPCGSGRKYKACHLGRERHALEDRAGWLYEKARRFLRQRAGDVALDLAAEMAEPIDDHRLYRQLRDSPFVADLALHEGGIFADFLAARDRLLPDDEALLAAQWAMVDRSVFEIERIDRDRLDLRDIASGERITVVNTHPSDRTRPGTVMLGRPLPVGNTFRAFGGFVEVPRGTAGELLDAIADGDATLVAYLVGETFRPPRVQNSDGEDLVLQTIRWAVRHPERVGAALEEAGVSADKGGSAWSLVRDSANRPNTVIASLRMEEGELVGEVNSERRAEELMALVATALPDAELVDVEARRLDEALADFDPADAPPRPDLSDPVLRQVMAEFIAEQERRWLDESIPALGGRTPREAAGDPVGREELEHLLASFPEPDSDDVGAMSPARLRHALGL